MTPASFGSNPAHFAQFGINGNPQISRAWRENTIPDDPRQESNTRGTIAFAFAVPNGRTTQAFINLRDNSATHDAEPFVPFGRVVEGMDVADALYADYGESSGSGILRWQTSAPVRRRQRLSRSQFPSPRFHSAGNDRHSLEQRGLFDILRCQGWANNNVILRTLGGIRQWNSRSDFATIPGLS